MTTLSNFTKGKDSRELAPSPYFFLFRCILLISMCLQKLMNVRHLRFQDIRKKKKVSRTDGRTTWKSIPHYKQSLRGARGYNKYRILQEGFFILEFIKRVGENIRCEASPSTYRFSPSSFINYYNSEGGMQSSVDLWTWKFHFILVIFAPKL